MRVSRHRTNRAFTLVELLVVIGIIAALIGILLPVLSGVSARGRDIKCQSNLRQICQAFMGYAAENKGSMPYGFYYNNSNNQNPDPTQNDWQAAPGNQGFISWASQVGRYMNRRGSGLNDLASFPPTLQCPELNASFPHLMGYVANMVVTVFPRDEVRIGGVWPRAQFKPPPITLMLKEGTALVWDTAVEPGWFNQRIVGYLTGGDIDGQRFWNGAHTPQFRYYNIGDTFGNIPPGVLGQNKPVRLNVGSTVYQNIDPPDGASFPYQGNLRFRHAKGTACNVGFSDGSVRQFTAKLESDGKRVKQHDALRKFFMIKWPPGVPPNTSVPF